MKIFVLNTEYITMGQFLKANDYINSGGEAKFFLFNNNCRLNKERCQERGKKIYKGAIIKIKDEIYEVK